jgi:type III restriction enzyme
MKLQFKEQNFQLEAVKAVVDCFEGQPIKTNRFTLERTKDILKKTKLLSKGIVETSLDLYEDIGYRNASIQITENQLLENLKQVQTQNDIPENIEIEKPKGIDIGYNFTIEMETGTGKTYTYIRTMFELHATYGWSKFIIIVPSIAIREGVYKSFEVTQDHFQEIYNHKITPFIYNSSRPQDIENFASNPRISVMIINTQAFASKGADAKRIYFELDQFGSRKPIEILSQTNPILIIDEPQSVEGDTTIASLQNFNPLFTLRYSATHKNVYNKIYRLDALDAYNKKLVKKIQVKGINFKGTMGTNGYLYLENIILSKDKPPMALIEYEVRNTNGTLKRIRQKLGKGANLFELSGQIPHYQNYVIQDIDGYFNKITIKGEDLYAGEVISDTYEQDFRRIQIRETIYSHLKKEKQLYDKGIKVLSLFFIDAVDKYKQYNELGEEVAGEYAKIFEEEYNNIRNEFLDLFHQEYNNYLVENNPNKIHKGYMPMDYVSYLERDDARIIHNGYFSIDKKNRMIDPSLKKKSEESDDVSAYDLIMKDKERLLSFEEPTRFIFSHSALKEGWDNPNVFQICALKHSDATIRRRQEVGRGMRLCVNDKGIRLDYETVGDQVFEINKLTVIASESYEEFAKGLQSEIVSTLKDRPQKIETSLFLNKVVSNEKGDKIRIDEQYASLLNNTLLYERIADINGKITADGREKIITNLVPLPEVLEPYRADITKILNSVFTGENFNIENERNKVELSVNKNFYKKEFQELWSKINIKSIYEVYFDTQKLIEDSIVRINKDLNIADRSYEVIIGDQEEVTTVQKLKENEALKISQRKTKKLNTELYTTTVYDIIGEIVNITNLKRTTIVEILKKINTNQFYLVQKNPEEFIAKCSKLINETKASLIINNIVYHKIEERFDARTVFTNSRESLRQSETLKKHIYDYLVSDSTVEKEFADALEASEEVTVYAKLPKGFYITTPIAKYTPDWAIVFDKEKVRQIYFIAETKGDDSFMQLKVAENLKINCADEHFSKVTNSEVKFAVVSSYQQMMEMVKLS